MKQVKDLNVVAVVVTYNRFTLLAKAVAALKNQTFPLKHLIVIDNSSTDGTGEWLDKQENLLVTHQANNGASGGFYTGINQAAALDADFIWLMDDDTICEQTSLERLVEKLPVIEEPVGFMASRCNWTDGNPHLMNIPGMKPLFNGRIPFNKYDSDGMLLIESSSFVSLLVSTAAVRLVGLPYKDFFIWGDDQEFTRRITKKGYPGFYCSNSIVLHETVLNSSTDFYKDSVNNIWKHRYGFRNEFYMVKKNKGFIYFIFWLPAKVLWASVKILRIREADHIKFIRAIFSAAWKSIFFHPKIDMLSATPHVRASNTK